MDEVAVDTQCRVHIRVAGLVQGVGFRPFVYQSADDLCLAGFVANDDQGVEIEVQGSAESIDTFLDRLRHAAPPLASVAAVEVTKVALEKANGFQILASERHANATTRISPDAAICDDCLRELFDPKDRRYQYPFINCTNCGPRYTIVEGIPYDRPLTSMKGFDMCPECRQEYRDPRDRRFHAQPNACPVCGPQVVLTDPHGNRIPTDAPFEMVQDILRSGLIVAVKGLGGFHLAVDPHDDAAVRRLRERKGRAEKPFALMARDLETVKRYCEVTPAEQRALQSRVRPIVLLKAKKGHRLARSVVPPVGEADHLEYGFMLAYTPLHYLLLSGPLDTLVMTSANLSEEPIAIGNAEALERLNGIADYFLVHDRDILHRCDDSVVRIIDGVMAPIRRSRGFVPDPVSLPFRTIKPILACGGELKNTIALARGDSVFLSQHIGDLDNPSAYRSFEDSIGHLESILEITPAIIAHDMHPEYLSTKWANAQASLPRVAVQHHHAHLAAVMAEHGVTDRTIGIILDGTGYGMDGTLWGGEILVGDLVRADRFAWLRPFALPGGEAAIRHPWRTAFSLVSEARSAGYLGERRAEDILDGLLPFKTSRERVLFERVIEQGINAPLTSSCGRLFDGVSALLGLSTEVTYEAQAAIALEMAAGPADGGDVTEPEGIPFTEGVPSRGSLDWRPMLCSLLADLRMGTAVSVIARTFHVLLADLFVNAALCARDATGINRVGLSGGVYQNQVMLHCIRKKLELAGMEVLVHRLIPTNDGGLAYGQVAVAAAQQDLPSSRT